MKLCEQCGHNIADTADACPYCGFRFNTETNKQRKKLLIVLFSIVAVAVALGITITVLLLNQKKPKTFDFNCAQYTQQMNELLGKDNKLEENKWVEYKDKGGYTYNGSDYTISLDTDKDSHKVSSIGVSPSDSKNGVNMAAASMMVADSSVTQKTAMDDLVDLKNGKKKAVHDGSVTSYDEGKDEYRIIPSGEDDKPEPTKAPATAATTSTGTMPAATTAPATEKTTTEPVTTKAATEPPTEPPTEAIADWKQLYINFLNNECVFDYETGKLVYLNDDDIPELILCGSSKVQWSETVICWISGNEVKVFKTRAGDICGNFTPYYTERGGYVEVSTLGSFTKVASYYAFDGSSVTEAHTTVWQKPTDSGFNVKTEFKIDEVDVTKEEVESFRSTLGSFELISDRTDKSGLISYIESY